MTTDHNEAMNQLPHKLATLIKCLPQAPFRDHLAGECIKQAERIAELERLSTGLSTVYNEAMDSLRIAVDERDTLRAEVERLTKPFGESHLVSLIEAAIQGHASTREAMRWFAGQITPKAARTHKETE